MTAIESVIVDWILSDTTIAGLIGDRIFPQIAPQTASFPRIVYQVISRPGRYNFNGPSSLRKAIVQLSLYGSTYRQVRTLALALEGLVSGYRGTFDTIEVQGAFLTEQVDDYADPVSGEETGVYRIVCDLSVWYKEVE